MEPIISLRPGLLESNQVPLSREYDLIRQVLIPTYDRQVHELDVEIEVAEAKLKALHIEREKQYALLEAHKALLAPVRHLNPDVLLEIFRHCHSQRLEARMWLACVCRTWRTLVLSTPTLWSVVPLYDTMVTRRIVPIARACAKYSGSCPIKVVIKFIHNHTAASTNLLRRALFESLDILAHHMDRWQTLEIHLDRKFEPRDGTFFKLPLVAPLLERLVLMTDTMVPFQFSYLPKLQDLRLFGMLAKDIPLLLQYTALRVLHLGNKSYPITKKDCWTILSNCSQIEKFEVTNIDANSTFIPEQKMTLSNLRQLSIGPTTADLDPIMSNIKTPALEELRLLNNNRGNLDASWLTRLVQESRPPLTELSLANVDGADVATCLPILLNLESLVLQQTFNLDLVICCLTKQNDTGKFNCPALIHLGLQLCSLTGEVLLHFARERRRIAGGLKVVVDKRDHGSGNFGGLTIELWQVGELTDVEVKGLYDMQS